MKKIPIRKFRFAIVATFLMGILITAGCDKDEDQPEDHDYSLSGNANGGQEVPAVTTNGTGTITGNYNDVTNILNYTITWTGLSGNVTNSHFHGPALPGVGAGVALGITLNAGGNGPAGTVTATSTLTEAQELDLLGGRWYYNLHTAANPGGEIRGQVTATK